MGHVPSWKGVVLQRRMGGGGKGSVAWATEGWLKTFLEGIRDGMGFAEGHPNEHRAWQMEWRPLSVLSQEPEVGPLAGGLGE